MTAIHIPQRQRFQVAKTVRQVLAVLEAAVIRTCRLIGIVDIYNIRTSLFGSIGADASEKIGGRFLGHLPNSRQSAIGLAVP
jgi:hypothetical protein